MKMPVGYTVFVKNSTGSILLSNLLSPGAVTDRIFTNKNSLCTPYIYTLDDEPEEGFLVPHSIAGRESSVYLSYMIDHYDDLAPYNIFIHGKEYQWHNDVGQFTPNIIKSLRLEAVSIKGYVNLRCATNVGCPSSIHQVAPERHDMEYQYLIDALPQLFSQFLSVDPAQAPVDLGHQCCAQFAVTADKIRTRRKADYMRISDWIATTDFVDQYGIGWLLEKLWHVFFGMPAV